MIVKHQTGTRDIVMSIEFQIKQRAIDSLS